MTTYTYSQTVNIDGTIIRKRYEVLTRGDGSTFLDEPNTLALTPQVKDASDNWIDRDISLEDPETQAIAGVVWTDDVKASYRNNN